MLKWRRQPHPWFQALIQWALYRAIIRCDEPSYFNGTPLSTTLDLHHLNDLILRGMCAQLLLASKGDLCYRPSGYHFSVLYRVISWALRGMPGVLTTATSNIFARYFPAINIISIVARPTRPTDYDLLPTALPAPHHLIPEVDRDTCLFGLREQDDEDDEEQVDDMGYAWPRR